MNIFTEKKEYEKEREKYISLLNNYRKRIIVKFMLYFKSYYYSFIKKHFHIFILKVKNFKNNYDSKKHLKFKNDNVTEKYINSYNNKKIRIYKDFSNPKRKINSFLLYNNKINFSSKGSSKKVELYRNNIELFKKYSEIIKKKRRKKINEIGNEEYSQFRNENKSMDISSNNNPKNNPINNSFESKFKSNNIFQVFELNNSYKSILNVEKSKENIKKIKSHYNNIKLTTINHIEKKNKTKENLLNNKLKFRHNNYKISQGTEGSGFQKENKKKYHFIKINKKDNKIIIFSKNEKINNIKPFNSDKNYISKKIKNIVTLDKKMHIHINYVFFIPHKVKTKKNFEKLHNLLRISQNYSYYYLAGENAFNKNKIYSKEKLNSIKEEEEKSKCSISFSMTLQNSKTFDE